MLGAVFVSLTGLVREPDSRPPPVQTSGPGGKPLAPSARIDMEYSIQGGGFNASIFDPRGAPSRG